MTDRFKLADMVIGISVIFTWGILNEYIHAMYDGMVLMNAAIFGVFPIDIFRATIIILGITMVGTGAWLILRGELKRE